MFMVQSDADAEWEEEIEIVSSFECKFFFLIFWGSFFCHGKATLTMRNKGEELKTENVQTACLHPIFDIIPVIISSVQDILSRYLKCCFFFFLE